MMQPTPSQRAAMERHKSFHAAIAAKAAIANPAPPKAVLMQRDRAIMVWPVIPVEVTPEPIVKLVRPIHRIIRVVAREYDVSPDDIISARRTKDVVLPRHIAVFFAKEMTPSSLPEIGRRFGKRDHTTILHAIRRITAWVDRDPEFAAQVERVRRLLLKDSA